MRHGRPRKRQRHLWPGVYFVAGAGLVKIGHSIFWKTRYVNLCNMSPVPLVLLGVMRGGAEEERCLHAMFAHLWHHGEWFRDTIELRCWIVANVKGKRLKKKTFLSPITREAETPDWGR